MFSRIERPLHCRLLAGVLLLTTMVWALGAAPGEPGGGPPVGPPAVERWAASFALGAAGGLPGDTVLLPFLVESSQPLSMLALSAEFDPSALEFLEPVLGGPITAIFEQLPGGVPFFSWTSDPEAGWLQLALILDFEGGDRFVIPPGLFREMAKLRFRLRPEAPPGDYPVVFTRPETASYTGGFHDRGQAVYNAARRAGRAFPGEEPFTDEGEGDVQRDGDLGLQDGVITASIIGDVGIFARGDANLDEAVNISDPMRILQHLFQGGEPLPCPAVADVNLDGHVDISDAITILDYLFLGRIGWQPTTFYTGSSGPEGAYCSL
jgi:hypothetical protein